ncbi:DUF424 family protein [Candidatus Pacearchaeota archaeon]|nr:DUF424 family protein [Candidatus Pacearchaeota archaeon]
MFVKITSSCREIVAICDFNLIGKKFGEGKFQLDVKENFYKGEEVPEEKVIDIMQNMSKEDATFNIVGKKSVNCALKAGIISKEGIKKIKGIPFAMIFL